jgi:hypothetical protein
VVKGKLMARKEILIQPGPIFWEVFRGAMTAHGIGVTEWARQQGFPIASLKPMATGGTNGEKSKAMRAKMVEAVGEETFRDLYEKHLRHEGLIE